ncbi:Protein PST-1 a [Aphelenchoides avenae]|nr:Protein PST-1 a [Aphelenchus avenae]
MMVGVNTFSAILCLVSLLEQGTLFSSLSFMFSHEGFSRDSFLLSISGAIGQKFGPVVFAVIMTVRQIFSVVLSSMYFSHVMSITGVFGLMVVFGSIFVDTYRKYFAKSRR